jgi:stringent starvation protein B
MSKHEVFKALILKGSVYVHLDGSETTEFCILPPHLIGEEQVILQVGLDMPVPIPDLMYTERTLSGTLSFKGVPFCVCVPWSCVYALVGEDRKGMIWEEDMPASILRTKPSDARQGNVTPIKGKLRLVQPSAQKVKSKPGSNRSHLRLVSG